MLYIGSRPSVPQTCRPSTILVVHMSATDREIDRQVYALHGLTEEGNEAYGRPVISTGLTKQSVPACNQSERSSTVHQQAQCSMHR